jgi:metal-responsive CopG/Arc/MetJ family transcriptional regulator
MKTIAITIDDETLDHVNRLVERGGRTSRNRSQLIRQAVHDYVLRVERLADDEREAAIVRRHRGRLARQANALVREQTKS